MKRLGLLLVLPALMLLIPQPGSATVSSAKFGKPIGATHKLSGGARWHGEIPSMPDLPLTNGDLSYNLFYEYHEGIGFWQLGAAYCPSPDEDSLDYIATPQISLILEDRGYRLGAGALRSRVKSKDDSLWTDVYWQILGGIMIPIGKSFGIDLFAHYIFDDWDQIKDSDHGALEFSALLSFSF